MRTIRTMLFALLLLAASAVPLSAAHASAIGGAAGTTGGAAAVVAGPASPDGAWVLAGTTSTPSPGDTASTGPANPGTGESGQQESTRLDFAPWVIGAIALLTLVVVLIWRRRRNTTII